MYTYYLKAKNINEDIFEKRGNWKRYSREDKLNFLFIETSQFAPEKIFYNIKIDIENKLKYKGKNKYSLVNSFLKSKVRGEKNLVMNQMLIDTDKPSYDIKKYLNFIKDNEIYILKPVTGYAKKGIEIIPSKEKFIEIYKKIKKQKKYNLWVIQEYITNPLLYLEKKFHFRCFYILTQEGKAYLYSKFWVALAKKKYKEEDYLNKDIHISIYRKDNIILSDDNTGTFSSEEFLLIKKALIKIHSKIKDKIKYKSYPNVHTAFHIFGSDIMFTEDYKPKILELNASPATTTKQEEIFEGIMQEIVDKKFPPKNKIKKNNYLIKL